VVSRTDLKGAITYANDTRKNSPFRPGVRMQAEAKTKPTSASVDGYLAAIADDKRIADCKALVKLMAKLTKKKPVMWGPSIVGFDSYHYKYDSGREGDACLMGFSSRGSDIAIYVVSGFEGTESILSSLGKHKTSKACLYIKRLADIDVKALEALLRHSASEIRRRYPAGTGG
jgi:hypothetical protein